MPSGTIVRIAPTNSSGCAIHFRNTSPATPTTSEIPATTDHASAVDTWLIATPHMSMASVFRNGVPDTSDSVSGIMSSAMSPKHSVETAPVRAAMSPSTLRGASTRRVLSPSGTFGEM